MAKRVIYEVYAKIVDANGSFNTLSSETFDSAKLGNDEDLTYKRAEGKYHEVIGAMCKVDSRQVQNVMLNDCYGNAILSWSTGKLAELPDANEG